MRIKIATQISAPLPRVWSAWTTADDIVQWNFASDDWCCPSAAIDLVVGGTFSYRMQAKDESMAFDFTGNFTEVVEDRLLRFKLEDAREVSVVFSEIEAGKVRVEEQFEAENALAGEQQRQGWQAILDNFRRYVETGNGPA